MHRTTLERLAVERVSLARITTGKDRTGQVDEVAEAVSVNTTDWIQDGSQRVHLSYSWGLKCKPVNSSQGSERVVHTCCATGVRCCTFLYLTSSL